MYTAMGFMPKNSVLLIDESSAALASRVGHGVAVSSFNEMNLNTRKQNSIVIYMSAMDWEITAGPVPDGSDAVAGSVSGKAHILPGTSSRCQSGCCATPRYGRNTLAEGGNLWIAQ